MTEARLLKIVGKRIRQLRMEHGLTQEQRRNLPKKIAVGGTLVPVYTPTRTDEPNMSRERVLFGGISVYLQQYISLFRKTPRFLDRVWDSPRVIGAFAGRAVSNDPRLLGNLTISMLRGKEGVLQKEFEKLLDWVGKYSPSLIVLDPFAALIPQEVSANSDQSIRSCLRPFARLAADYQDADKMRIEGSPTFVLNEGRQKLYGNVGFRVIEANIQELLRAPAGDQASWC